MQEEEAVVEWIQCSEEGYVELVRMYEEKLRRIFDAVADVSEDGERSAGLI